MHTRVRRSQMQKEDVDRLRQKLEAQRHETVLFLLRMEQEAQSLNADSTQDSADQCVISVSKEALFERSSQRRTVLRLIESALNRIADGSFGRCVGCGDQIQDGRLQALPWTQFCLQCQEELEEKIGASLLARTSTPAAESRKRRRDNRSAQHSGIFGPKAEGGSGVSKTGRESYER